MKKHKKLDKIVAGVLLYYFAFVVVAWIAFFVTETIPDTLVQVGLGGGVVELVATAAIKIMSDRREHGEDKVDIDGDIHDDSDIC